MTKKELLDEIAEYPEDGEILAYHVTRRVPDGIDTSGGIDTKGEIALAHAESVLSHVAQGMGMEVEDVIELAVLLGKIKKNKGLQKQEAVRIDKGMIRELMEGADDADQ